MRMPQTDARRRWQRSNTGYTGATMKTAKALMKEGGVIACEAPRHPWPTMHPSTRAGLIETAQRLDPMVLRWGR